MTVVKMFNYIPEHIDLLAECKRILSENYKTKDIIDYPQNNLTYTIRYKIGEDKVVFVISYGKSSPHRCYNRTQSIYDDSVLSDEVIHMTNEFIYVIYKELILCSDHNKRNVVLNMLNSADKDFSCNLSYVSTSIEDFIKQVKSIDTISIKATNNLFIDEFLNPKWGDDIDKERPNGTIVKMEFKRALSQKYIIDIYKKLKRDSYISNFDIKGESSEGFISINEESIVAKDAYEFEKKGGYYDIDDIFEKV